jgi:hypothetical protein
MLTRYTLGIFFMKLATQRKYILYNKKKVCVPQFPGQGLLSRIADPRP